MLPETGPVRRVAAYLNAQVLNAVKEASGQRTENITPAQTTGKMIEAIATKTELATRPVSTTAMKRAPA